MFCRNCGKQLQDGDRFCFGCGTMQDVEPVPMAEAPRYNPMTTESAPMGASVKEEPRKKKSKKKKVLVLASIVTALALMLGVMGWSWLFGEKEVIYVRTEARTYTNDGKLCNLKTWQYDERGMMLRYEMDYGLPEVVWDDKNMVYTSIPGPVDSKIDTYIQYEYGEQGNVDRIKYTYYSDDYEHNNHYHWKYEGDHIVSVIMKDESDTEFKGIDTEYVYSYDQGGNLTDVYSEINEGDKYSYKMAYDAEGRMTQLIRGDLSGDIIYDFAYDKEGRLENYVCFRILSTSAEDGVEVEGIEQYSADLEYTDDGLLLSFGDDYEYEYNGNKLIRKRALDKEYCLDYNGDVLVDQAGNLIYDKNGSLIRVNHDDGTYTEYDYLKLELSEEDAHNHYRQQQAFLSELNMDWVHVSCYDPVAMSLPIPVNPRLLVWPVTEYK